MSFFVEFVHDVLPLHFPKLQHVFQVEWKWDEKLIEEEVQAEEAPEEKMDEFDEDQVSEAGDKKVEAVKIPLTLENSELPHPRWLQEFWKLVGFGHKSFEQLKDYSLIPSNAQQKRL